MLPLTSFLTFAICLFPWSDRPVQDILTLPQPDGFSRIPYGPDPNHFGDLRLPKSGSKHPVVVNIHGGFWRARYDLTHAGHLCAALTREGYGTWNLEYRRVGNPGGGWPGSFEDVTHGLQFLPQIAEKYRLDLKRVIVMGHSAGGQLALVLAAHQPSLRGVVSLAGVADMRRAHELKLSNDAVGEFLGGSPESVAEHYREADPMELPMPKMPQRLIHGTKDDIVPIEISRRYRDAKHKAGEPVNLVEVPNAGHFDLIDPRTEAWKTVESVARELVR
jgi:acetyl esterase/lipase